MVALITINETKKTPSWEGIFGLFTNLAKFRHFYPPFRHYFTVIRKIRYFFAFLGKNPAFWASNIKVACRKTLPLVVIPHDSPWLQAFYTVRMYIRHLSQD